MQPVHDVVAKFKSRFLRYAMVSLAFASVVGASAADTTEQAFLTENAAAMDRMMRGMNINPSGNVDADFANMMEPHHQGAIDMAEVELRYGMNEQLRRIAQEIIVDQQQEIVAMRLALGRPLPAVRSTPDQGKSPLPLTEIPSRR